MHEVLRNDFLVGVSENSLEFILRSLLHGITESSVGCSLLELDGEIDNGDVDGGDTEGHAGELSLEFGENETDGLSGTSRRGNDVGRSSSSSSPVFATLGGSIDNQLGSSRGMDCGHETFEDTELIVEDLSDGSKAVGSARSIRDDVLRSLVLLVVNTVDVSRGGVLSGSREDDFLSTTLDMGKSRFLREESTSGLADDISTVVSPLKVRGVLLSEEMDDLSVNLHGLLVNLS